MRCIAAYLQCSFAGHLRAGSSAFAAPEAEPVVAETKKGTEKTFLRNWNNRPACFTPKQLVREGLCDVVSVRLRDATLNPQDRAVVLQE